MFRFPFTLSSTIRQQLEGKLKTRDLSELLQGVAEVILSVFRADRVVGAVQFGSGGGGEFFTVGESLSGEELKRLRERWFDSKIHSSVVQELRNRRHPVSYSGFSWPFPRLTEPVRIPGEYSLIIPFDSETVVRLATSEPFIGYFVVMLPSFPTFDDELVQCIITLPTVLSELVLAALSTDAQREESLNRLAYEVRQQTLNALRLTSVIEGSREVVASLAQILNRLELNAEEVLVTTRTERPVSSPLSVNQVVGDTVSLLRPLFEGAGISVLCELEESLPLCSLDPGLFPVVVHRLLDDTIRGCQGDEGVTLRTRCEKRGIVLLELFFHARPENECDLSLVQYLVESHEGRIFAYSGENGRVAIVLELPVSAPQKSEEVASE